MRSFDENPIHTAIMASLKTDRISCISCHNMVHNASEVDHLKMWVDGDAAASPAAGSSSPAAAKAETATASGPSKSEPKKESKNKKKKEILQWLFLP